jgi:hypothetical protein
LKAASLPAFAVAALALAGCAPQVPPENPARMASLKATYDQLHDRLERAVASEPLVAAAIADRGQVVLAMRSGLLEELAGTVARRYLDRVTVDLSEVEAHGSGELGKKTFLGRIKVGDWNVSLDLGNVKGNLRAGAPRVGLRGPDLIDIELPVDVQETEGDASLHFGWESAGLANVVCNDFEITREIRGRVLAQRHRLSGALRLDNTGESLTATPVFPDRHIQLKLDLTTRSWGVVEAALRSQDTAGKCGILMDPEKALVQLRELAARGVKVRLPDSIFRAVSLPARLQKSVKVHQSTVGLRVSAEALRIRAATLWSSASVQVQANTTP